MLETVHRYLVICNNPLPYTKQANLTSYPLANVIGYNLLPPVVGGKVEARDIVDGHRQKTLQLLWALIFVFKVSVT